MKNILLLFTICVLVFGFKKGDNIRVMVNKISPYANPTESYRYYDLPFCQPSEAHEEPQSIGEKLSGNRKTSSVYKVEFRNNVVRQDVCTVKLDRDGTDKFREAIKQNYIFEMFVEDFAVGNVVGFVKNGDIFMVRHVNFNIYYNKKTGSIVKANIDFDQRRDVANISSDKDEREIKFSYSVFWRESNSTISEINTGNDSYFADEIHWFSFLNAFFLVTFLVIIVWLILQRISKNEVGAQSTDLEGDKKDDDMLWKLIRVEVFKCPPNRNLLSASVGSGFQLVLLVLVLFIFGVLGMYYQHKGSILTAAILLYSLTACNFVIFFNSSVIAGFISSRFFRYLGGISWHTNVIVTSILFPLPLFGVAMLLNNIAWASNSTAALPFSSVVFVIFMWGIVTLPLTLLGALTGKMRVDETLVDVGDKVPKIARPIPKLPFYHSPLFTVILAGLLPFSAMQVELYYIFSSMWGHKVYTMYGMIFMVFVMVINMTACISIILTYFQLNSLDYRWWWRSFFYGGSSGFFVFAYAIYFYLNKTEMFGFLQVSYYFGYSALFSLAIFLMMGSVGFLSSMAFVQHIYERSKID